MKAYANDLLQLVFNNVPFAGVGDEAGLPGSDADGSLYISLHTAAPAGGSQASHEVAYEGYERVAVARTSEAWDVSGSTAENVASVAFPASTGTIATATHFGVGIADEGEGKLLYFGALEASRTIRTGDVPVFGPGKVRVTEQ